MRLSNEAAVPLCHTRSSRSRRRGYYELTEFVVVVMMIVIVVMHSYSDTGDGTSRSAREVAVRMQELIAIPPR